LQWLREFIEEFVVPATAAGLAMPTDAVVTAKGNGILLRVLSLKTGIGYVEIEYRFNSDEPFIDITKGGRYRSFDELLKGANLK
ncbi:MAG: hypothetical protein Q6370_026175, partial [Candidatus Sigynarchaeota archaeon]